jgi:hypothetical protein
MNGERAKLPIEQMCTLSPAIKTDLRVERRIEIARECLTGDPFRQVPEIYSEAWVMFEGGPADVGQALPRSRHVFAVAEVAFGGGEERADPA